MRGERSGQVNLVVASEITIRPAGGREMGLTELSDPKAILAAVAEFDEIGREEFLTKYGFGPSRSYFLLLNGKLYDSKPIMGAAHG